MRCIYILAEFIYEFLGVIKSQFVKNYVCWIPRKYPISNVFVHLVSHPFILCSYL